ncbi:MAG TPA: CrcB family protein [Acidimicrobiales bacterium]|nr:CrcB family protein [Acidimicrobiales bacterium]
MATASSPSVRRRAEPAALAAIAAGGALGTAARYGVSLAVPPAAGQFPWATFLTNVSGCLALGLVLGVLLERFPPGRFARPFLATGFLGAYTTWSTFAVEVDLLAKDGHAGVAAAYAAASLVAGCAAAWAGVRGGRSLPGRRGGGR